MTPVVRTERKMLLIGWLAGLATAGGIAGIALTLILTGVIFNTSATQPHTPLFAWGVHATMKNSVARRSRGDVPRLPLTRDTLLAGAREYEAHCVVCHGGPGVARAPWVSGMLPTPPYLIDASSRWSHAELYNLVHDGVKMTGMPAWEYRLPDQDLWNLTAFLKRLPDLSTADYAALDARFPATAQAAATAADPEPVVDARGDPRAGRKDIDQYLCAGCHEIPGVASVANTVGPDLKGIGSRAYIGGMLPNTRTNMVRWLRDPQQVKPGTAMPNLHIRERDLVDIAAYLETLGNK